MLFSMLLGDLGCNSNTAFVPDHTTSRPKIFLTQNKVPMGFCFFCQL